MDRRVRLSDIARVFLKIGAMSYGGPAIMGVMQSEIQEKRGWIDKPRFVEGLSLANMLPGPVATQLGIFIGHEKGGVAGGLVAGLCFILPAFVIMLVLSAAYAAYGSLPLMRDALYGVGPVVLGIFGAAVYRLGRNVVKERSQMLLAVLSSFAVLASPIGVAATLLIAGCCGVALFHSRKAGLIALAVVIAACALARYLDFSVSVGPKSAAPSLWDLATFFFEVGALTFGGGLSMVAFIQEQVVGQLGWLAPREFIDGLAIGQLTPGPVLMLAAFVGFKTLGAKGALVSAAAVFLPSFLMMLAIPPLLQRFGDLRWLKAFMRGAGPAVIGALAASLLQMAPHAAPDLFTATLLVGTMTLLVLRNASSLSVMIGGGMLGAAARSPMAERLARWMQ